MNIRDYIDNPLGKGATIPGKQFIIDDYNNRFNKLVMNKSIELKTFVSGNKYIYHFIIPTESDKRDNTYDVVIMLTSDDKLSLIDKSLVNYNVTFFSNCPSFTYTYAYAYNMNGLLIQELDKMYDDIILKRPPVSRNPGIIVNYEKSLYFACKYILDDKNLLNKAFVEKNSSKLPRDYFKKNIRTVAKIEYEIKSSRAAHGIKEKEKKRNSRKPVTRESRSKEVPTVKSINKITARSSTSSVSSVNRVKKIKPKKR